MYKTEGISYLKPQEFNHTSLLIQKNRFEMATPSFSGQCGERMQHNLYLMEMTGEVHTDMHK